MQKPKLPTCLDFHGFSAFLEINFSNLRDVPETINYFKIQTPTLAPDRVGPVAWLSDPVPIAMIFPHLPN